MADSRNRFRLLGIDFFAGNFDDLINALDMPTTESSYICVANVHTLVTSIWDKELRSANSSSTFVIPDGKPLSLAGKLLGNKTAQQLRGPDFMRFLMDKGREIDLVHYLYGAGEGIAEKAARNLCGNYPGLKISGFESPPFRDISDLEIETLFGKLKKDGVNVLWIGLGAPKQEKWMLKYSSLFPGLMIGTGAAFDFLAGVKGEAPVWVRKLSLEWLFRLWEEPKRLWKRYLITNPLFVIMFLIQYFGFGRDFSRFEFRLIQWGGLALAVSALSGSASWWLGLIGLLLPWMSRKRI